MNLERKPKPGDCFVVNSKCSNKKWFGVVIKFERCSRELFLGPLVKVNSELKEGYKKGQEVRLDPEYLDLVCSECLEQCQAL